MRIAIASPGVRGPATYTLNLYKYLAKAGHQVLLTSEARWKKEEIPVCFYRTMEPNMDRKQDYTYKGFAAFVRKHKGE